MMVDELGQWSVSFVVLGVVLVSVRRRGGLCWVLKGGEYFKVLWWFR